MNEVWEMILPYVTGVAGVGAAGTFMYIIQKLTSSGLIRKNTAMLQERFDINKIASAVSEQLVGKGLNIDVTAIAKKEMERLTRRYEKEIKEMKETVNSQKRMLALLGMALSNLKALTDSEQQALLDAAQELDKDFEPVERPEPIAVILEPIPEPEEAEELDGSIV